LLLKDLLVQLAILKLKAVPLFLLQQLNLLLFLVKENDPYEVPKKMGIYKKLESNSTMTTETIIHSIIENRNKLAEAHAIKKKKLENYYKSQDATVRET